VRLGWYNRFHLGLERADRRFQKRDRSRVAYRRCLVAFSGQLGCRSRKFFSNSQPHRQRQQLVDGVIRFEEAYATVQNLCRQLINNTLTRQRMRLVTNATEQELGELEKYARLALIASPLQNEQGVPADAFIDKIMQRDVQDELKKALLASFVMSSFGRATLEDFLRTQRRR